MLLTQWDGHSGNAVFRDNAGDKAAACDVVNKFLKVSCRSGPATRAADRLLDRCQTSIQQPESFMRPQNVRQHRADPGQRLVPCLEEKIRRSRW